MDPEARRPAQGVRTSFPRGREPMAEPGASMPLSPSADREKDMGIDDDKVLGDGTRGRGGLQGENRAPQSAAWARTRAAVAFLGLSVVVAAIALALPAYAHHEAVLGPHSASVIGASGYAGVQCFTKRTAPTEAAQETSLLFSGGIRPFPQLPVSFNLTLPVSVASGETTQAGFENALVSARYRLDLASLQRAFGKDDNYLMFLGGIELPTGNMDQPLGKAPVNALLGMMASFERGAWAAMGFVLGRLEGTNGDGFQKGHEVLMGGGLAYTPVDDSDWMWSFQLGSSYELGLAAHDRGVGEARSGYQRVMLTPAFVARVSPKIQLLGYASFPIQQRTWNDDDRVLWRFGAGMAYFFAE